MRPILLALSTGLSACGPMATPLIIAGDIIEGSARIGRAAVVGTERLMNQDRQTPAAREDPPAWPADSGARPGGNPFLDPLPPIVED